jgi:hypothetical protein
MAFGILKFLHFFIFILSGNSLEFLRKSQFGAIKQIYRFIWLHGNNELCLPEIRMVKHIKIVELFIYVSLKL